MGAPRTLETLVIRFPLEDRYVERLRTRFPDLSIHVVHGEDDFRSQLPLADAVVGWGVNPEELALAERLRWIQTVGAGVDGVITPELVASGILLTNNSGVHAPNIAEHLMALMLAFARQVPQHVRAQDTHTWRHETWRSGIFELNGQTLLVVGLGDIGQALAKRAAPFGMQVIGVRRREGPTPEGVSSVVTLDALPDVLAEADHVAICLPLTAQTRGVFGRETIYGMKQGSFLYNIGRGSIVDQPALIDALSDGHLGGAGLDVTDPEPLPPDSPLWELPNAIITSHTSGVTPNYWDRAIVILESNIERYRSGSELLNVVDLVTGY